jgi:cytochrome c5
MDSSKNTQKTPTPAKDVLDLSCFELLSRLRSRLFLSRAKVVSSVTASTKDETGKISWVEFEPDYHSHLIKIALNAIGSPLTPPSLKMAKKCLFVFIIDLLNGHCVDKYFELAHAVRKEQQAKTQRKRIARKRKRAAKRERDREEQKLKVLTGSTTVKCEICGRNFTSRKTIAKHACESKKVKKAKLNKEKNHPRRPPPGARESETATTTFEANPISVVPAHTSSEPPQQTSVSAPPVNAGSRARAPVFIDVPPSRAYGARRVDVSSLYGSSCEVCHELAYFFVPHGGHVGMWHPKCRNHADERCVYLPPRDQQQ